MEGWELLCKDLVNWKQKQEVNLRQARLDPQDLGHIQGVLYFIDKLLEA